MPADSMPTADVVIDERLVRALLEEQHADLAGFALTDPVYGWDNVMFRLGPDLLVRLPRRLMSASLVLHEQRWLPSSNRGSRSRSLHRSVSGGLAAAFHGHGASARGSRVSLPRPGRRVMRTPPRTPSACSSRRFTVPLPRTLRQTRSEAFLSRIETM